MNYIVLRSKVSWYELLIAGAGIGLVKSAHRTIWLERVEIPNMSFMWLGRRHV